MGLGRCRVASWTEAPRPANLEDCCSSMGDAMAKRLLWLSGLSAILLIGSGCRTASPAITMGPVQMTSEPVACPILEAKAEFSCWNSDRNSPASHCVLLKDHNPSCGLPEKAMAYFNRGAQAVQSDHYPSGSWFVFTVFEDEQGRVGQRGTNTDGRVRLMHHTESALITGAPINPVRWPRWPAGLEGGPEQRRD